jgi:hypothetical protein
MEENGGLSIADALAIARGNGDGFGGSGNGLWWIIILVLFLGWGGRGNWGNNGGGNGVNTVVVPANSFGNNYGYGPCCSPATAQGMTDAFNFSALNQGITSTHDSVVDGFYQNNLATTGLGTAMQTGFANATMNTMQGFNGVQ